MWLGSFSQYGMSILLLSASVSLSTPYFAFLLSGILCLAFPLTLYYPAIGESAPFLNQSQWHILIQCKGIFPNSTKLLSDSNLL